MCNIISIIDIRKCNNNDDKAKGVEKLFLDNNSCIQFYFEFSQFGHITRILNLLLDIMFILILSGKPRQIRFRRLLIGVSPSIRLQYDQYLSNNGCFIA